MDLAIELKNRTKQFALDVIKQLQVLPKTEEARTIGKQLLRSSCSVAANYRAVCRGRSDAEFYSKLCIVVEEADESVFWLEMLTESGINNTTEINRLLKEANEILAIMAKSKKTAKNNKLNTYNKSTFKEITKSTTL